MESRTEGWVQGTVGGRGSPPNPNWKPLKIFTSPKQSLKLIVTFAGIGLLHLSSFYLQTLSPSFWFPSKLDLSCSKHTARKNLETFFFFSFKIIEKQTNSLRVSLDNICWQVHRAEPVRVDFRFVVGVVNTVRMREKGCWKSSPLSLVPSSFWKNPRAVIYTGVAL